MSEARLRGKIRRITDALDSDPVDVPSLKDLSITADGYIAVDLRCKVWSKLLNVNTLEISRNKDKKIGKNMQTKYMYKFTKTFSCSSADIASNCEIRSVWCVKSGKGLSFLCVLPLRHFWDFIL